MQKEDTKNAQIGLIYPIVQEMCRRYPHLGSEDLAQDVALKLLKYQRMLPRKPRRGWISAVVRNAAIDRSRELKREREIFDPMVAVDADGEMAEGTNGKIYFAHAVYPEQEADRITMEAIRAAFEALPETQRECCICTVTEGVIVRFLRLPGPISGR